jgi:hypothetical protein
MAKNTHTDDTIVQIAPTHGWVCDTCGNELTLTNEEIEELEQPRPGTRPEDWDYYMPCPLCKKGEILQPTFTLAEALQSIAECEE